MNNPSVLEVTWLDQLELMSHFPARKGASHRRVREPRYSIPLYSTAYNTVTGVSSTSSKGAVKYPEGLAEASNMHENYLYFKSS